MEGKGMLKCKFKSCSLGIPQKSHRGVQPALPCPGAPRVLRSTAHAVGAQSMSTGRPAGDLGEIQGRLGRDLGA